jgi:hypothetical protein
VLKPIHYEKMCFFKASDLTKPEVNPTNSELNTTKIVFKTHKTVSSVVKIYNSGIVVGYVLCFCKAEFCFQNALPRLLVLM